MAPMKLEFHAQRLFRASNDTCRRAAVALHRPAWQAPRRTMQQFARESDRSPRPPLEVYGPIDNAQFRELAFAPETPLVMRRRGNEYPVKLPALNQWFNHNRGLETERTSTTISPRLRKWADLILEYEMMCPNSVALDPSVPGDVALRDFLLWMANHQEYQFLEKLLVKCIENDFGDPDGGAPETKLLRFSAPLALLFAALDHIQAGGRFRGLYIAQSPLGSLPLPLQQDVPTPDLVQHAGKGDIYGTSVWMGLEPTYTPLHRDPNPNLFCQLCGFKSIRLLPPSSGTSVFMAAQKKAGALSFSPRLGVEMMTGLQRDALDDAVWGPDAPANVEQAILQPGDAMFIPKGWWHSVKSVRGQDEAEGPSRVNCSVNWWFR